MSFVLISSSLSISFHGSKGAVVIAGGDGLDCVALGSTFFFECRWSCFLLNLVFGAVLVGLLMEYPFAKFLRMHCMQENPS